MSRHQHERPIQLGIVGAGRAAERIHLPAIRECPECECAWIADLDEAAATELAGRFTVPLAGSDLSTLTRVDGVVIATPPESHAPIAKECLERGQHVLCEKPFVTRSADGEELVRLAEEKDLVLAVGLQRRYYPVSRLIRRMIAVNWLGRVRSIDAEEGLVYDWQPRTSFRAERPASGGGVLIDTGSHTIDRILWWLGDRPARPIRYEDDSHGGPETDCELEFAIAAEGDEIPVSVTLSRTRTLRNRFRIVAEKGVLQLAFNEPLRVTLRDEAFRNGAGDPLILQPGGGADQGDRSSRFDAGRKQIADFSQAIATKGRPLNDARSTLSLSRLIDWCYDHREQQDAPWVRYAMDRVFLRSPDRA